MNPDKKLADLQRQLDALGDERDVLQTDRALETFYGESRRLLQQMASISAARDTVAELTPKIAAVEKWRGHLIEWRTTMCDRMAALPPRYRDRSREEEQELLGLRASIANIDRGCDYLSGIAMVGPSLAALIKATYQPTWDGPRDPWAVGFGSLVMTEGLLAELQKKRDDAQAALDALLREPVATV